MRLKRPHAALFDRVELSASVTAAAPCSEGPPEKTQAQSTVAAGHGAAIPPADDRPPEAAPPATQPGQRSPNHGNKQHAPKHHFGFSPRSTADPTEAFRQKVAGQTRLHETRTAKRGRGHRFVFRCEIRRRTCASRTRLCRAQQQLWRQPRPLTPTSEPLRLSFDRADPHNLSRVPRPPVHQPRTSSFPGRAPGSHLSVLGVYRVVGLALPRTTAGRVGPALWCPVELGSAGSVATTTRATLHRPTDNDCSPAQFSRPHLVDAAAARNLRIPVRWALG